MPDRYFVYDPEDCNFETYSTEEARDKRAAELIEMCLDDGWSEAVDQIVVGVITHQSTKCDVITRPETEEEREKIGWNNDYDEICSYKMMPVTEEEITPC